jgi:hypothetical protein
MGLRSRVDRLAGRVGQRGKPTTGGYFPPSLTVVVGEDGQVSVEDEDRIRLAVQEAERGGLRPAKGGVRAIVARIPRSALETADGE